VVALLSRYMKRVMAYLSGNFLCLVDVSIVYHTTLDGSTIAGCKRM
jgi:hypothetical protein